MIRRTAERQRYPFRYTAERTVELNLLDQPPIVWPPRLTYPAMRRLVARVLPGARFRRHLYWRYSLVWPSRSPARPHETAAAGEPAKVATEEPTMRLFSRKKAPRDPDQPGLFQRLVMPRGHPPDQKLQEIRRAAEADVEQMEAEDRKYFRQDAPGKIEDDL